MRVYPTKGDDIMLDLCFEHLYLISHIAMILGSLLSWHNEMRYHEVTFFLPASENSTSLYFDFSVQFCNLKEIVYYLHRTHNLFETCRLR